MSMLEDLIHQYCPNGVEHQPIGNYLSFEQPSKYLVESTKYDDSFPIPVLTAGQTFILGYTNETKGIYEASKSKPVIIFDDFTTSFHWVEFPFKVKSSAMKMLRPCDENRALFRFLYYCMKNIMYIPGDHTRQWIGTYSKFEIPIPPLPVQEEIVRVLDTFTELQAELQAELQKRLQQYNYYRDYLLSFEGRTDVKWKKLGDICSVITKGTTPPTFEESGVSFVKTECFEGISINKKKLSFVSEEIHNGFLRRSILNENDILITIAGATIGKCVLVPKEILPANTNQALAIIRVKKENNYQYIFHIVRSGIMTHYIKKSIKGSAQPNLSLAQLNDFLVPIPSPEEQKRIVDTLDRFDALATDLTAGLPAEIEKRRQQYEFYRDKLLTFERK